VLFTLGVCRAAEAQYRFDLYDTSKGMPQNSVTGLVLSHDGYLWLTTNDGLARFDGARFTVFNKSTNPEFSTNRLGAVLEDKSHRIWFNGEDGSVLFYQDGRFTVAVKPNQTAMSGRSPFFEVPAAGVLFYSDHKTYNYAGGRFVQYPVPGLPDDSAILLADKDGGLWFSRDSSVYRVKNGNVAAFDLSKYSTGSQYLYAYEDRYGDIWLSFTDQNKAGSILRIRNGNVQSYPFPARLAWHFTEDQDGDIWFTVYDQNIIYRISREAAAASEPIPNAIGPVAKVEGVDFVGSAFLCPDHEGGMWLGAEKGLWRIQPQTVRVFSRKDGLLDENVYPIYEDHTGNIWAGIWPTTLAKYERGTFHTFLRTPDTALIASLFQDGSGRFWFAGGGRVHYLEGGKPVEFTHQIGSSGEEVSVISQDSGGALWFGAARGLIRYADGRATRFTTKDGLPDNYVTSFLQTRDGKIWIGTHGGVAVLDPKSLVGGGGPAIVALTENDGLAANHTRCIYQDTDDIVWIGSYDGGLTRYQDGKLTRCTQGAGLHSNGVFCILEDSHGWFWMNSNQGIYRVRKQDLNDFSQGRAASVTSIAYSTHDGLLNIEGNGGRQPAGIRSLDGRLWFPTAQGIAMIDPEAVSIDTVPPPVLIEDVEVDRKPVPVDAFRSAAALSSAITLSPGQSSLEIHYTGLSLVDSEQVKFKYRLEGLDDRWNDAGTRRFAYYSYLAPGHYSFQVVAANRDGLWSDKPAIIRIVVLPPFYRTWWFTGLIILTAAALGTLVYQTRVRQLTRARVAQEEFSRRLIYSQEGERKRIAGELHDSLNQSLVIIKNRAVLSLNSPEDTEHAFEQLEEIAGAATRAIDEVREIAYNLRPFQLDRLGLTKSIESMVRRVESGNGLLLTADLDPIDGLLSKDSEVSLYRIVQESLNNILKHARATEACVSLGRKPHELLLTIRDNGVGIPPSLIDASGPGFGLAGMNERVRILGGTIAIDSGEGQGTTITVRIPIQ
jgi:signal transduction histidine kinase/ligand-binding sensor domain-containing protein